MTREEAVKWLESLKSEIGKSEHRSLWHYAESIDMAIEELNREQQIIENGYAGKEMRIRIGGKLFAVRELAQ